MPACAASYASNCHTSMAPPETGRDWSARICGAEAAPHAITAARRMRGTHAKARASIASSRIRGSPRGYLPSLAWPRSAIAYRIARHRRTRSPRRPERWCLPAPRCPRSWRIAISPADPLSSCTNRGQGLVHPAPVIGRAGDIRLFFSADEDRIDQGEERSTRPFLTRHSRNQIGQTSKSSSQFQTPAACP